MKKIYLASDSRARKELLELFGLKFTVLPSRVKERVAARNQSFSQLVKNNARQKAHAVAGRITSGVVIAADTIVVDGKKIFGKPRDRLDAHRMLKRLSGRPQWIYSGVCVIDKDTGRMKTASERTKIYMDPLSDTEIDAYFKYVSPLDKAGSFDIQGRGGFFIRRIEGCFYNVVGLPIRRLYRMLKDMGISVFGTTLVLLCSCALVLSATGCSTEYNVVTGQQEIYYYSTEREVAIGRAMTKEVEKQYKLVGDPLIQDRVQRIGAKIAAVSARRDIDYTFTVLKDDEVNAVSLPGGFVYVNKGLVDKVANDDELAAVLAHEVGHIVARHSVKKLQAIMGYSLGRLLTIPVAGTAEVTATSDAAFTTLMLGYGREDELLADKLGARYTKAAGYNPQGMITFLEKLQEANRHKPLRPKNYLKTHPYTPDRIRVVKEELGQAISFDDYINIEDKPHE